MDQILSAQEMRACEAEAIDSGHVTGRVLMARAGHAVVHAICGHWPLDCSSGARVAVLCGPGNNGGDGYVIARALAERGADVTVYALGDPNCLPPDAAAMYAAWRGPVHQLDDGALDGLRAQGVTLVVDALFGTGLTRPLQGLARPLEALAAWRASDPAHGSDSTHGIVAVDLPSGLCADSGRVLAGQGDVDGSAVWADMTVTFHRPKRGHVLAQGPARCGRLVVADIGLVSGAAEAGAAAHVGAPLAAADKDGWAHKFSHGHALVVCGGRNQTGAARLAARAALRIGAGLVTLGVPSAALPEVAAQVTAIMLTPLEDATDLADMLNDRRIAALCLGPALGIGRAPTMVARACADGRAVVLDADALSAFAQAPDELFSMLHAACVLTPHWGEFQRLFPDLAARLDAPATMGPAFSKIDIVQAAAARAGCTVLLKGADTVIVAPDGKVWLHAAIGSRAAPWLATAGAGDVLAGLITGLLARGWSAPLAAAQGAWLHVEAACNFGPGMIAEDLPDCMPGVLQALTKNAAHALPWEILEGQVWGTAD